MRAECESWKWQTNLILILTGLIHTFGNEPFMFLFWHQLLFSLPALHCSPTVSNMKLPRYRKQALPDPLLSLLFISAKLLTDGEEIDDAPQNVYKVQVGIKFAPSVWPPAAGADALHINGARTHEWFLQIEAVHSLTHWQTVKKEQAGSQVTGCGCNMSTSCYSPASLKTFQNINIASLIVTVCGASGWH